MQLKNVFLPLVAVLLASFSITVSGGESPPTKREAGKPSAGSELAGKLVLRGSNTMAPMMEEIARRFTALHPKVTIEVRPAGSRVGVETVRSGSADLGMVSRPLEASEEDLYAFPVARSGVALIVHRDNRVHNLSKAQIARIFTGKASTWKEVGGASRPIKVFRAEEGTGSTELILHYLKLRYEDLTGIPGLTENTQRVAAVKSSPDAIAFLGMGYAERAAAAGEPIRLVAIDGIQPSSKTVRSGDHQLSRPLILLTKDFPKGLAKAFISFALSSQATETVKKHDFVPYLD